MGTLHTQLFYLVYFLAALTCPAYQYLDHPSHTHENKCKFISTVVKSFHRFSKVTLALLDTTSVFR